MKYWGPINSPGGINGNDSYVNANPSIGVQGSIPTFQAFEQPLRGLNNLIESSRMTPNAALDDLQIAESIRSQRMNYIQTFGGTANQLTCSFDPVLQSLAMIAAMPIRGIAAFTNTGPCTLTAGGLPERPIITSLGQPLLPGDIIVSLLYTFYYNATLDKYVMGEPNGAGRKGEGTFDVIRQPALFAQNTFTMGENVPQQPGGYTIMAPSSYGDGVFNTANGTFKAGVNTQGAWQVSVSAVPPVTQPHNTFTIAIYGSHPMYTSRSGVALVSATMIDWDGGYATHLSVSGVIQMRANDFFLVSYYALHSTTYVGNISAVRIAGGP